MIYYNTKKIFVVSNIRLLLRLGTRTLSILKSFHIVHNRFLRVVILYTISKRTKPVRILRLIYSWHPFLWTFPIYCKKISRIRQLIPLTKYNSPNTFILRSLTTTFSTFTTIRIPKTTCRSNKSSSSSWCIRNCSWIRSNRRGRLR